jgi:AraC family transcriptional activator of pobA
MPTAPLEEYYQEIADCTGTELRTLLPDGIRQDAGHFNVFELSELWKATPAELAEPLPCRSFYKISLLHGGSRADFPDARIDIASDALVFSSPKTPFYWRRDVPQTGVFCVFTAEFLRPSSSGVVLDELPLFRADTYPIFALDKVQQARAALIFGQMREEMASDYAYKYDLLRTYVLELIHLGQKLQPASALHPAHSAAARLASRFSELLEQQFPIETPQQTLRLRTAKDYADHLAVHVNHLNKILKETTHRTTTELIASRIGQEAEALLRQTDWPLAAIADSLGFADVAHFSHFFRRHAAQAPGAFRSAVLV